VRAGPAKQVPAAFGGHAVPADHGRIASALLCRPPEPHRHQYAATQPVIGRLARFLFNDLRSQLPSSKEKHP
jgi:hypothetical protein